jgi:4-amino-4-deoxy-L-arabinose transferase-like glycosyltransferase
MISSAIFSDRRLSTLGFTLVGFFLLINVCLISLQLVNKPFNPDELQHAHIGWSIAHGEILYRDFWEHHGPLYGLLNGTLIYVSGAVASTDIIFAIRSISFGATLAIFYVVWLIARRLSFSALGALAAVAICSSLSYVQIKGIEMRPDALQSLFWVLGLYYLICAQTEAEQYKSYFAGALFGLSIMANAKAGIGPFFVVVYYLISHWVCAKSGRSIWLELRNLVIGGLVATVPFVLYFLANSALEDFFYFNFVWNVLLNYYWSTIWHGALDGEELGVSMRNTIFMVQHQLPMLILTSIGLLGWIINLFRIEEAAARQAGVLFAIAALGCGIGWALNQHAQFFLIFLPLWSVFASYAFVMLGAASQRMGHPVSGTLVPIVASVAAAIMLLQSISTTPFRENPMLSGQISTTARFIAASERDELVAITWNTCGAYMFNQHASFYWVAMPYISEVIEKIDGQHPFAEDFVAELEEKQVRYVIGHEEWQTEGFSSTTKEYLKENFSYSDCVWTRNDS